MAKKTPRAGRTLLILGIVIVAMYALIAFTSPSTQGQSRWQPKLGLDLEGGTRITLTAAGRTPTATQLAEARTIIDQRVNGSGVAESEVSTQGGRNIVAEIPGQNAQNIVDSVARTAQLRFRLVAGSAPAAGSATSSPSAGASSSASPSAGASGSPSAGASTSPSAEASPGASATPNQRVAPQLGRKAPAADPTPSPSGSASSSASPSAGATGSPSASASPSSGSSGGSSDSARGASVTPKLSGAAATAYKKSINDPLAWQSSPDQYSQAAFAQFTCPKSGAGAPFDDDPDAPLIACDSDGNKYLLSKTVIEGTQLRTASSGTPQQGVGFVVQLQFKGQGTKTFATVTRAITGGQKQFAIVLDNTVLSAPGVNEPILNGSAEISGDFTEGEARSLANSLKFGALPIRFADPSVEQIGASLAGDQLSAGVIAGIVGLLLVMLYCLVYYRGLGAVVVASLVVAAVVTYAAVLLLAKGAGFTLTLPGIAGLIVAVGITADSFIVYFERIRDEMRDGKSMRVAVELGWARARNTCLAADAVSLLAAVVLYVFTIGVVKGFAFALGVSTLIDLAVFFWFTKPMMTTLARRRFFSSGHPMSGLSYETLGVDAPTNAGRAGARTAGGKA